MKKKVGRPKIHKGGHHTIVIRQTTYDIMHIYQKEQSEKSGIEVKMVDIVDIAIKALARHENFFQFAIDIKNNKE